MGGVVCLAVARFVTTLSALSASRKEKYLHLDNERFTLN